MHHKILDTATACITRRGGAGEARLYYTILHYTILYDIILYYSIL